MGFRDGWRGVREQDVVPLPRRSVRGISRLGGTILGTSRTNPLECGGTDAVRDSLRRNGLMGLIAIGGEGTLAAAKELCDQGINVVGVPKTIDNDLGATDYTFGFDSAVQTATEAIDRLRTTGESHHRCMIAEVMGRNAGWIALHSGMASGAHAILIPEHPVSLDQISAWVLSARDRGRAPLVVVAEAFVPEGQETPYAPRGLDTFGRPMPPRSSSCSTPPGSRPGPLSWATSSVAENPPLTTVSLPPGWAWPPSRQRPAAHGGPWCPSAERTSSPWAWSLPSDA